ncbi:MAG: hypothetical protein SCH71_10135 [Desulfobulbaceae bacterium]|nr:hypothetical protein [Desulfobulbaceae bacterium]
MAENRTFKTCPLCARSWESRKEFLDDGTLKLNGYQADMESLEEGLFLFTHHVEGCFTTMSIRTRDFYDLYTGIKYPESKTGTEDCPGYCLHSFRLDRCDAPCECAFVREIIQIILEHRAA